MGNEMRSGTAAGLIRFLQWTQEKGLLKPATAGARRSAAQQILEIDGEDWAEIDVRSLDVDDQFQRFAHLRGAHYSPSSLNTYGQRFRDAVALYLEYLANPTGFRAPATRRSRTRKRTGNRPAGEIVREAAQSAEPSAGARGATASRDLITYPFPLQSGELAYIQLPVQVAGADAERLCAFIRSIAIENE